MTSKNNTLTITNDAILNAKGGAGSPGGRIRLVYYNLDMSGRYDVSSGLVKKNIGIYGEDIKQEGDDKFGKNSIPEFESIIFPIILFSTVYLCFNRCQKYQFTIRQRISHNNSSRSKNRD